MADLHHEVTVGFLGQLRRQLFPFFFELRELHLDEFVMRQSFTNASEKGLTQSALSDFADWVEMLGASFQGSLESIRQRRLHQAQASLRGQNLQTRSSAL